MTNTKTDILKPGKLAKVAGMISAMILVSRLLGFLRETIIGRLFERSQTDAFYAAFVIPDFMYYILVGGALSAAFIPLFSEYLAKGDEEEGWRMASTFINITIILLATFTLLGMVFARYLAPLEAYDFRGEKLELLIDLTRMMFPAVFFTALAGLMGGILNSYQHFFVPVLGPVLYNIGIILGAFFLGPHFGVKGMAVGVVVGAIINFFTQAFFVRRLTDRYSPLYINLEHPGFRKMLTLMVPALIGLSATQLNIWASTTMASGLSEGSITALRFAQRLVLLPLGIFAMAISTAFFPTLSRLTAKRRWNEFRDNLSTGIRVIIFIMIPSAVGFIMLRYEIVRLLFEGRKFTPEDTRMTAYALLFYSLGLFAHGAIQLLPRGFYALKDTVTPVKVTFFTVVLSILMNLFFLKFTSLQHGGLALSFSLMGIANMLLSMFLLRRKIGGINGGLIIRAGLLSLIAAGGMGVVLYYLMAPWSRLLLSLGFHGNLFTLFQVAGGIGVGIAVYLGLAHILNMEELALLRRIFKRD